MKRILLTKLFLRCCLIACLFFSSYDQLSFGLERDKYLYFNDIDGLPQNIITCIEQDKYGYTWIGTKNGISRFDGNKFKNYDELKGQMIRVLLNVKNDLWLACENGLYFHNRISDCFELKYEGYVQNIHSFSNKIYFSGLNKIMKLDSDEIINIITGNNIQEFCITNEGFWVGNDLDGVKFIAHSNIKQIKATILKGKSVSVIRKIGETLLFGCTNGELFVLHSGEKVHKITIANHHAIKEIIKVNNEIWLATDGNGIIILDEQLNYKRSYRRNSQFKSNSIYDIYLGSDNEVWVANYGAGLLCLIDDTSPFKNIIPEPGNRNSLVAKEGVSVFKKQDKIYFGTNYGLSVLEESTGIFSNYSMNRLRTDLKGSKVLAVNTDDENNFWIGTYDGLLGKYTSDLEFIRSYQPCGNVATDMQRIVFIHKYKRNNLLIATHYRDRSLLNFNLKTKTITPVSANINRVNTTNLYITSIRENHDGKTIVLLRTRGLFDINIEQNILVNNLPEINKRITFPLLDFYQDTKGYYWLATMNNGLVRMSENGRIFDNWTTEQGLPSNNLLRIESTDDKYLWISTISGLCRFEMENGNVLIFNHKHGLPANEFTPRTSTTTNDGRIIFGSNAGFTIVDPQKVQTDISETKVVISDITFHNQSIKQISDKPILSSPLEETKEIKLPFNRNSFTIHFFSKDMDLPKYNNYAYRLIGLESEWIFLGETKHTTYTNLSPGKYTFEVKCTNKSNVWSNSPTQIVIQINPPWYLSIYALLGYAFSFFLIIGFAMYAYAYRIRLRKEVEFSEYKVEAEHELTEKKLAFFTNVSHDLKTPLTLISAPLEDLIHAENLSNEQRKKLQVIYKNSGHLYKLINDLLDFRRLTQKQLPLMVKKNNIKELIENTCAAFYEEYTAKAINFMCNIELMNEIFIDSKKVEKILWNLLSNAIKFTPEDGKIYLNAALAKINDKQYLRIQVEDTGIGIAPKNKEKIFERFYQVGDNNKSTTGTGIGLSIVKDLVEIHHGFIEFSSVLGKKTTFIVNIPSKKEYYSEAEIDKSFYKNKILFDEKQLTKVLPKVEEKQKRYNLPKILLAEDNIELLDYLGDYFEKNFKVYKASDGRKALLLAKEKNPDIIVTDVLMPYMNGYEFCKTIKQKFETSHIPIIILTANSTVEQQVEGLEMGADAYIPKPFNIKLLEATIMSTLETRQKIKKRIVGISENADYNNKLTNRDINFVTELKLCIEKNIGNHKLNVELLSEHFAMSKPHLTRKIKTLTGQTPNNLIKSARLKKAYDLIKNEGLRVSEASDITGFSDPNYFTICFRREFGKNPSKI